MNQDTITLINTSEDEIVGQLVQSPELTAHFHELLAEIYSDTSLTEERTNLCEQTQSTNEPHLESLSNENLKLILKIRGAIKKALAEVKYDDYDTREMLKDLVIKMQDGDLAYTTYAFYGGHADAQILLGTVDYHEFVDNLRFSPELQSIIAMSDVYGSIPLDLANNHSLTDEAQMELFRHEHPNARAFLSRNVTANCPEMLEAIWADKSEFAERNRMDIVFSDRDLSPSIVALIKKNPQLDLIYRAKNDHEAEMQMIQSAIESEDDGFKYRVYHCAKLLSEEAVRLIVAQNSPNLLGNKNRIKHSGLMAKLGVPMD